MRVLVPVILRGPPDACPCCWSGIRVLVYTVEHWHAINRAVIRFITHPYRRLPLYGCPVLYGECHPPLGRASCCRSMCNTIEHITVRQFMRPFPLYLSPHFLVFKPLVFRSPLPFHCHRLRHLLVRFRLGWMWSVTRLILSIQRPSLL